MEVQDATVNRESDNPEHPQPDNGIAIAKTGHFQPEPAVLTTETADHKSPTSHNISSPHSRSPNTGSSTPRRHSSRHHQHDTGFIITERIGKGSFATVYKGEWGGDSHSVAKGSESPKMGRHSSEQRQKVAIKVVQRSHLKKEKRLMGIFEAEMAILKQMKHPHVVHLIDVVKTSTDFNLIMEYCSLGDLSYFIRKKQHLIKRNPDIADVYARYPSNQSGLHPHLVRHFLAQLACSSAFLREHDIVHRDVKPQNSSSKPGASSPEEAMALGYAGSWDLPVVKIADFGFARFSPSTSMAETSCGSPSYMAPEISNYEKYNAKADSWSVGAVTFEMATGKPPFPAVNHLESIRKIDSSKDQITFPFPVEQDIEEIVRGSSKRQPNDRMNFNDFFKRAAWSENFSSAELGSMSKTKYIARSNSSDNKPNKNNTNDTSDIITAKTGSPSANNDSASAKNGDASANNNIASGLTSGDARLEPTKSSASNNSKASSQQASIKSHRMDDSAESDGSGITYSQYLRRQGANCYAIESPTPSPESSETKHKSPRSPDAAATASAVATNATNATNAASKHRHRGTNLNKKHGDRGEGKTGDSENEYVFIEKRMVEVNALADDLQAPPGLPQRRSTNPDQAPRRRRSSSIAYGASPTNALAQASLKSSARLFGAKADPNAGSPSTMAPGSTMHGGANPALGDGISLLFTGSPQTNEKQAIDELEQLATIAKVVSLYAEVKYMQSDLDDNDRDAMHEPGELERSRTGTPSSEEQADLRPSPSPGSYIDPFYQMTLANESLVSHLKALSILAKAMTRASEWWDQQQTEHPTPSPGINALVQWIRDKFNECVYRAETERASVKRLTAETESAAPEVTAESLLFDRASEMAKAAAVQEMAAAEDSGNSDSFNEAAAACEMNYGTAVWMLRSSLIAENETEELSDQDRIMVETSMAKIAQRLVGLRRKLATNSQSTQSSESFSWKRKSNSSSGESQRSVSFGRHQSVTQLTPP